MSYTGAQYEVKILRLQIKSKFIYFPIWSNYVTNNICSLIMNQVGLNVTNKIIWRGRV